jgi:hypothetical protein
VARQFTRASVDLNVKRPKCFYLISIRDLLPLSPPRQVGSTCQGDLQPIHISLLSTELNGLPSPLPPTKLARVASCHNSPWEELTGPPLQLPLGGAHWERPTMAQPLHPREKIVRSSPLGEAREARGQARQGCPSPPCPHPPPHHHPTPHTTTYHGQSSAGGHKM